MEYCFKLVVETAYPTIFLGNEEKGYKTYCLFFCPRLEEILATAMFSVVKATTDPSYGCWMDTISLDIS